MLPRGPNLVSRVPCRSHDRDVSTAENNHKVQNHEPGAEKKRLLASA
jgi:hypothetical protein